MVTYNFKKTAPVPSGTDFVDIILSKTQRKTPTIIHKHYAIGRIRAFYMRKVKFTQQTIHDRLTQILDDFPRLDDIHPFYADLMNVLYDKDHYKIALGKLAASRRMVDQIGQEYVRLLKYADSMYRCKCLKRAALGRMCTLLRKQNDSLQYLEEVRQHLARLPSIDPSTRTLILCGYPNVGKSSFMNSITRANVEVESYAFTTRSIFVGHTDYNYLRWQILDTPGILDHPLEEMNNIEMQTITALAHLRAAILYLLDLSEACGFSIEDQISLFKNIKPLFANKPLFVVVNKADLATLDSLPQEKVDLVNSVLEDGAVEILSMSTLTGQNVMEVRNTACDRLLQQRVETKMKGKTLEEVIHRVHVAQPNGQATDESLRPVHIPESVLRRRAATGLGGSGHHSTSTSSTSSSGGMDVDHARVTEKVLEAMGGGPGVYVPDLRKKYLLEDDSWRYDVMPEIMDGRNIADFVDADILRKLHDLEVEENQLLQEEALEMGEDMTSVVDLDADLQEAARIIRERKELAKMKARMKKNKATMPRTNPRSRTIEERTRGAAARGMDVTGVVDMMQRRGRSLERRLNTMDSLGATGLKRGRDNEGMDVDGEPRSRSATRDSVGRSLSRPAEPRGRSQSRANRSLSVKGIRDPEKQKRAQKVVDRAQTKLRSKGVNISEADRSVQTKRPKHLFTGKRTTGKTDRR